EPCAKEARLADTLLAEDERARALLTSEDRAEECELLVAEREGAGIGAGAEPCMERLRDGLEDGERMLSRFVLGEPPAKGGALGDLGAASTIEGDVELLDTLVTRGKEIEVLERRDLPRSDDALDLRRHDFVEVFLREREERVLERNDHDPRVAKALRIRNGRY